MDQIFPYKDGDVVKERHVYSGSMGEGYFDIEYKLEDGKLMKKVTHTGAEARESHDWKEVPMQEKTVEATVKVLEEDVVVCSSTADPIVLVLNGECDWVQDVGVQLKETVKTEKQATLEVAAVAAVEEAKLVEKPIVIEDKV